MSICVEHANFWGGRYSQNRQKWEADNRGIPIIVMGYSLNHENDCYWAFNLETNYVHNARDVIWLVHVYYFIAIPTMEFCSKHGVVIDSKLEENNHTS